MFWWLLIFIFMLDIREIEANPEKYKNFVVLRKGDAKVIDEVS